MSQDLCLVENGDVVARLCHVRVVIAQHLLADDKRLLMQTESLLQLALRKENKQEIAKATQTDGFQA